MNYCTTKGFVPGIIVLLTLFCFACKKNTAMEEAKIKPPVRTYIVTARIDKKGTNSNSEGTAVLKGNYNEESKILSYTLEYQDIVPLLITLRSGSKGSFGTFVKELYSQAGESQTGKPIGGSMTLNPLQERNLLKGHWFVAVNTLAMSPEISGVLTFKQK